MEEAVKAENCRAALAAVKRNRGAAGIDRMEVAATGRPPQAALGENPAKLLAGRYVPSPLRRVEIPKPDGGTRRLGIPTVLDRFIQQLLLQAMTPIFEPRFSEHSYGFRPGRSAHQAVSAAQRYAQQGSDWVVDIDISQFFDQVNHDLLMARVAQAIRDKRVLHLIGKYLRSGAMVEGVVMASPEGTPQGGPLSPLLANIYLDALDRELEQRGHKFCRYADDCNIYVGSEAAAQRTLESIERWVAQHLRLKFNPSKSGIGRVWERKFLGFRLNRRLLIEAATASLARFKRRVRQMWRGQQSRTSEQLRDSWRHTSRVGGSTSGSPNTASQSFASNGGCAGTSANASGCAGITGVAGACACADWELTGRGLKVAASSKGAWRVAANASLHTALPNAGAPTVRLLYAIRSCGRLTAAEFNRWMRKTARPVVWEGG